MELQVREESGSAAPKPQRQITPGVVIRIGEIAVPSSKKHSKPSSADNPIIADMTLEKALVLSLWFCNFFKVLQLHKALHDQNYKGHSIFKIYLKLDVQTSFLQVICAIQNEMRKTSGTQHSCTFWTKVYPG